MCMNSPIRPEWGCFMYPSRPNPSRKPAKRFRRASDGPIFSALPEKMGGEKSGAGTRLVRPAGTVQAGTCFYSRYEHTKSPHGRFGTRRLLRYTKFDSSCL